MPKKILFLDILTDRPWRREQMKRHIYSGFTYPEHFRRFSGIAKNRFVSIDASRQKLPDPSKYSAIIIGGSVKDPIKGRERPWMIKTYGFIRKAAAKKIPILGICGGLQFVVKALGGTIIKNPKGRNFGNSPVTLTADGRKDPLFHGLPKKFFVQASHQCIARSLRPGWKLLAYSKKSPIDAIAVGQNIRLVQFHPEVNLHNVRGKAKIKKEALIAEEFATEKNFPKFLAGFRDTSKNGKKILVNFIKYFIESKN